MKFTNSLVHFFEADPLEDPYSRQVPGYLYSKVKPTPVQNPKVIGWSESVAELLELPPFTENEKAEYFSGNRLVEGMNPVATRYGGHQFGHWAGQLGDGRAILMGEIENSKKQKFEIQLKGAGPTPYSRRADGRAVLRSSMREFICSEAMHFLGIPTSRALSLVETGDQVLRDMFYDGNPQLERGAIVTRVAPSFLRLGHFEILAANKELDLLDKLFEYSCLHFFPEISAQFKKSDRVHQLLEKVCRSTAFLISEWTRVGFVHGVMNTDNLSLLGLTIDYGPFGWLDNYDPTWTPNTTDAQHRRYRFENQGAIAFWNLNRFAEALLPLTAGDRSHFQALEIFKSEFEKNARLMLLNKMGLGSILPQLNDEFIAEWDQMMRANEFDYTLFFRKLSETPRRLLQMDSSGFVAEFEKLKYRPGNLDPSFLNWFQDYSILFQNRFAALSASEKLQFSAEVENQMNQTNPVFIPKNFICQEAIDAAEENDFEPFSKILLALRTPYEANEHTLPFHRLRPDWARQKPGCSMLSCSS